MTPLRELGVGLIVLAAASAATYGSAKRSNYLRIKNLSREFDRKSYPELFEARAKAIAWTAGIAFAIGLALLVTQP